MTQEDAGGPAFPWDRQGCAGMMLWDWYLGQSLGGLLASDPAGMTPEQTVAWAAQHADAAIAERVKRGLQ